MLITTLPVSAVAAQPEAKTVSASQFSDMPDNWSPAALEHAISNGLLTGASGMILPDDNLTRAQMATIIVRAFGAAVAGDLSGFSDVSASDWYADSLAKAYQMGVIKGSDGMMNPNDAITREQVFVILARALKLKAADTIHKTFADEGEISSWARGEVYALVNAGYVNGSDGSLNPDDLITRAEFAQLMYNIIKQYVRAAGTYTSLSEGNVMVNTPGVILENVTVSGYLIIGDGVGDGEVTLDNVNVSGRLVVRGGGENSIVIRGASTVSNVVVARLDGAVSVKVQGDANVEVLFIDDGSNDVKIEGAVGNVEIAAPNIQVTAAAATIGSINVSASNSTVKVDENTTVTKIDVASTAAAARVEVSGSVTNITTKAPSTQVTGTGTVTKVEAQAGAENTKIETPKTEIVVDATASGVTGAGGVEIEAGSTVSNNDDATGTAAPTPTTPADEDDYSPTPLTAAAITGTATVGQTLTASLTPSGATASYQWKICDTADGTYVDITGATSSTYTISADDLGKYLKISATGSGSYTETVTSSATDAVAPISLSSVTLSGTAVYGMTLTASVTPSAATAVYQWKICDTADGTYADITGATSST
jgi:hypothetical protein